MPAGRQVEPSQPIVVGWLWKKRGASNKASGIPKKNGIPNHTPNHTRIIPDSCFKLPKSEPWYICKIRTRVLWAFFPSQLLATGYASCCFWEKSDSSTPQRKLQLAMAPACQLQSAHTTLIAPWWSTLQQQRAATPFTSTSETFETFCGYVWVKNGETLNQGPRIIPANHTPESYPESYPRIIPPRQTSRKGHGIFWHAHIYIYIYIYVYVYCSFPIN